MHKLRTVCFGSIALVAGLVVGAIGESSAQTQSATVRKLDPARRGKAAEFVKRTREALGTNRDAFSDYILTDLATAEAALGNIAAARQIVPTIGDPEQQIETLTAIARSQADNGDGAGAKQTLAAAMQRLAAAPASRASSMPATAPGKNPRVLKEIGKAHAYMGDLAAARKIGGQIPHTWEKGEILAAIGRWQGRHGDRMSAHQSFVESLREILASEDRYPFFTAGDLARVQMESGDLAGARATIQQIADTPRRVGPLIDLANDLARSGDKDAARAALDQARQILAVKIADGQEWQKASVTVSLADAQAAAGDADGAARSRAAAAKLIEMIPEDNEQRAVRLAELISTNSKPGTEEASAGLEKVKSQLLKLPLERGTRVHACWSAAGVYARKGDGVAARSLMSLAIAQGKIDPVEIGFQAGSIAASLVRAEGLNSDIAWIDKLPSPREKAMAYAAAAAALTSIHDGE